MPLGLIDMETITPDDTNDRSEPAPQTPSPGMVNPVRDATRGSVLDPAGAGQADPTPAADLATAIGQPQQDIPPNESSPVRQDRRA